MLKRTLLSAGIVLLLSANALACSGRGGTSFEYRKVGKGSAYATVYYDRDLEKTVVARYVSQLPDVPFYRLRPVPNLAKPDSERRDGLVDDIILPYLEYAGWYFNWMTDGRHILWAGKIVRNPPNTPAVDAASFHAWGRFAADKYSLYFDGERTDNNPQQSPVDMATLEEIGGKNAEGDASDVVKDRHSLYYHGRRIGDAKGFTLLGLKSWDQRGSLIDYSSCEPAANVGPWDTLIRNTRQVFLNGDPIPADPDTFQVVRWMPGSRLIYRDKNGEKQHLFGRSCNTIFTPLLGSVTWRTRAPSPRGNDCRVETLPDVNPEHFNVISRTMGQYRDRVYIVEDTELLDQHLKIVSIADADISLKDGINVASDSRAYVVSDDAIQTVHTVGKMVPIKESDGENSTYFSHDSRYIYAFLNGRMWRYKSSAPTEAYINDDFDLVTHEGVYRRNDENITFTPATIRK